MRIYVFLLSVFLLIGCGVDEDDNGAVFDDNITVTPSPSPTVEPPFLNTGDDTLLLEQWSIFKDEDFYRLNGVDEDAHIHARNSLNTFSGKGIKVAVIDNGFEIHHPELSSKIISTYNFKNDTKDIDIIADKVSHGTAVTGIIAASANDIGIRGIAPDVELILLEMPDFLTDSNTIEMFDKAVALGADVINCSWGTGNVSDAVREHLNNLASNTSEGGRDGKGVLIVFASGNDNSLMGNDESSVEGVFGVGATSSENLRTSYSDYGPDLDIVAPGGEFLGISTLDLLGNPGSSDDEYIRYNEVKDGQLAGFVGTSASAPILSGVLALALEKNPNLTADDLKELLKVGVEKTSRNIPYMIDIELTNKSNPIFRGTLGTESNSEFDLEIRTINGSFIGRYSISFEGDGTWSSTVTDNLGNGEYKARLLGQNITYATDSSFIVKLFAQDEISNGYSRNDFYGYGKVNVDLLLENIN